EHDLVAGRPAPVGMGGGVRGTLVGFHLGDADRDRRPSEGAAQAGPEEVGGHQQPLAGQVDYHTSLPSPSTRISARSARPTSAWRSASRSIHASRWGRVCWPSRRTPRRSRVPGSGSLTRTITDRYGACAGRTLPTPSMMRVPSGATLRV